MKSHAILLAAGLLFPAPLVAQTITIGTATTYDAGPYSVAPAALQGFEKALAEALCKRAKLSCEWKAMARGDLLPALKKNQVDVVMAAIPTSAKLGKGVETTAAYLYPDPFDFIGAPGTEMHAHVGTVAAVSDPATQAWIGTTGYTYKYFPTLKDAVKFLESGGAQAVLAERVDLRPLVAASGGRLAVIMPRDRLRPGVTMALRADETELRFTLEDRIFDMEKDGSLNALTRKWFGIDASAW